MNLALLFPDGQIREVEGVEQPSRLNTPPPNPHQTWQQLVEQLQQDLDSHGVAYLWKMPLDETTFKEFRRLDPTKAVLWRERGCEHFLTTTEDQPPGRSLKIPLNEIKVFSGDKQNEERHEAYFGSAVANWGPASPTAASRRIKVLRFDWNLFFTMLGSMDGTFALKCDGWPKDAKVLRSYLQARNPFISDAVNLCFEVYSDNFPETTDGDYPTLDLQFTKLNHPLNPADDAMVELWGALAPDCGPMDYKGIVADVLSKVSMRQPDSSCFAELSKWFQSLSDSQKEKVAFVVKDNLTDGQLYHVGLSKDVPDLPPFLRYLQNNGTLEKLGYIADPKRTEPAANECEQSPIEDRNADIIDPGFEEIIIEPVVQRCQQCGRQSHAMIRAGVNSWLAYCKEHFEEWKIIHGDPRAPKPEGVMTADPMPQADVMHYGDSSSETGFEPYCRLDGPNEGITNVPEHVTCKFCLKMLEHSDGDIIDPGSVKLPEKTKKIRFTHHQDVFRSHPAPLPDGRSAFVKLDQADPPSCQVALEPTRVCPSCHHNIALDWDGDHCPLCDLPFKVEPEPESTKQETWRDRALRDPVF